jgi:hypothetical protein
MVGSEHEKYYVDMSVRKMKLDRGGWRENGRRGRKEG